MTLPSTTPSCCPALTQSASSVSQESWQPSPETRSSGEHSSSPHQQYPPINDQQPISNFIIVLPFLQIFQNDNGLDKVYNQHYDHLLLCLRCPVCRELISIPAGGVQALPPSFLVNQLRDLMARQRREVVPKCSSHPNQVLSQLTNHSSVLTDVTNQS